MKRTPLALVLAAGLMISCGIFAPPDHKVRVENNYSISLEVNIGDVAYGTVAPGATTSYKGVDEGEHTLSGDISGTLKVEGNGTHKWTLTIDSAGQVSIEEN